MDTTVNASEKNLVNLAFVSLPAPSATLTLEALRPVLDALETLECRVLSSSADVNALSHLARRAKFDLLRLVGGASCA